MLLHCSILFAIHTTFIFTKKVLFDGVTLPLLLELFLLLFPVVLEDGGVVIEPFLLLFPVVLEDGGVIIEPFLLLFPVVLEDGGVVIEPFLLLFPVVLEDGGVVIEPFLFVLFPKILLFGKIVVFI